MINLSALDSDLASCSVLALIQHANLVGVAYHLVDDRLVVHPHRTHPEIAEAVIARGDEVADFLRAHRPALWRTPPEEAAYRRAMADGMCMSMFNLPWDVLVALTIDRLADVVGEAWERHVARITPFVPYMEHDKAVASD